VSLTLSSVVEALW